MGTSGRGWRAPLLALGALLLLASCAPQTVAPRAPSSVVAPASNALSSPAPPPDTPAPVRLKTAYTSLNASFAPIWLGLETGAFAEQGIDAELTFIGPGQAILGALVSQETPIVLAGANQIVEATLQGGPYVLLGASTPSLSISILVVPAILGPQDLRGMTLGVSNFGAISHVGASVALEHWGLEDGRDVTLIRSGGAPETIAAMQNGAIHGGAFGPPQSFRARDMGFRELLDVATLGYELGSNTLVSTRPYVAQHPEIAEVFLKAIMRGVYVFKAEQELAVDAIMRYGRMDDRGQALETWAYNRDKFRDDLTISPQMVRNTLKMMADDRPDAINAPFEQFVDLSFLERGQASGYPERVQRGP